jgi:hypothetical protein
MHHRNVIHRQAVDPRRAAAACPAKELRSARDQREDRSSQEAHEKSNDLFFTS